MRVLRGAIAALLLVCAVAGSRAAWVQEPAALGGAAVFPFVDRRQADRQDWLGAFLREGIADALLRSGRVPVVGEEASRIWAVHFGPVPVHAAGRKLSPDRLKEAGLDFIVRGATQRVVNQAVVYLELIALKGNAAGATSPVEGDAPPQDAPTEDAGHSTTWELNLDLGGDSPQQALQHVLEPLFRGMGLEVPPSPPPQPALWASVEGYYGLFAAIIPGRPPEVASERELRLAQAQRDPTLKAKALSRLAQGRLEQARLELTDGARKAAALREGLRMLAEAIRLEPWDSRRMALKGEIHYFLKEDYEARTEASVARLRNPRDGLAYAVLGLVAGLSTAEGADWMKQALAADPYLRASVRPAGWPPFQRGVMEPLVAKYDELSQREGRFADPEFDRQIALGKSLFESRQWEEAAEAFVAAEAMETDSHLPRLYLARIRMESGDAEGAAGDLRGLAGEYPQESEVWYSYGLALEAGGQFEQAEEAFRHALEERADEPNALYHMALAQIATERWAEARNTLRILTERNSRHGQAWLLLGAAELQLESWRDAHYAFRQALQIDPDNQKARAGMKLAVEQAKADRAEQQRPQQ